MARLNLRILTVLISVCLFGCEEYAAVMRPASPPPEKEAKPASDSVVLPELAKAILRPARTKADVSRDPFQPLVIDEKELASEAVSRPEDLADWKIVGLVKVDDHFVVLMKNKSQRGIFRVNDKIQNFTIVAIDEKQVVLNNGKNTITMKRGMAK